MSYIRGMLNPTELVAKLRTANVERVAAASGVSTKTIYRIRTDGGYSPTLRTAEALTKALEIDAAPAQAPAIDPTHQTATA